MTPGEKTMNLKRSLPILAVCLLFAAVLATRVSPTQQKSPIAHTNLKVGDAAPDFTLPDTSFKKVQLSDFRGKKNVILAFYVLAFTGG
jgi:cytochrome oxidase Cu insertion factor (SCO1/SenC/PrrC family)